jgi:glycosyltransferase involved in cell wall biosynthesis
MSAVPSYFPRISVVTPSFNQGAYIGETIRSVIEQDYPNIELIVIDAVSTDNTVEVLKQFDDRIAFWVSEKDEGQADALNKGFERATGDICCYINSDDCFYQGAFRRVAELFVDSKVQWVATTTVVSQDSAQRDFTWVPDPSTLAMFVNKQTIPQQGVFWRTQKSMLPYFDKSMFYAMDQDFFVRLYMAYGPPVVDQTVTSFFRQHPNSKTSLFDDRLQKDQAAIRSKYLPVFDDATRRRSEKEYKRLVVIRSLQDMIARGDKIGITKSLLMLFSTPYALRSRQFFSLLLKATF